MTKALPLQLGIDLGGTKTEVIVLDDSRELFRHRIFTPSPCNMYPMQGDH